MSYLAASALESDLSCVRERRPDLWRQVRRFNLPVQLAVAAACEALRCCSEPSRAVFVSLAPCRGGSLDLYQWGYAMLEERSAERPVARINPTHTLHAVDNLALSWLAILYGNHSNCLGLGGSPGQAWCALEWVLESNGQETDILVMAGDQESVVGESQGLGVALLFAKERRSYQKLGRTVRLTGVKRSPQKRSFPVRPHAARGLGNLLSAVQTAERGELSYLAPRADTDGMEDVVVLMEVS